MNPNLYIVISINRHRDNIYTLFKTEEKAIEFAKKELKAILKNKKAITKEEWDYMFLQIVDQRSANWLDGEYGVEIVTTNYPV